MCSCVASGPACPVESYSTGVPDVVLVLLRASQRGSLPVLRSEQGCPATKRGVTWVVAMAHHEGHEGHEGKECMFPYSVGSRLPCGVLLHGGDQRCACAVACISTWQTSCPRYTGTRSRPACMRRLTGRAKPAKERFFFPFSLFPYLCFPLRPCASAGGPLFCSAFSIQAFASLREAFFSRFAFRLPTSFPVPRSSPDTCPSLTGRRDGALHTKILRLWREQRVD